MHGRILAASLALLALALAPAADAATPMRGQTYEGPAPKGGQDVILVVSKSGARVKRLTMGFERGCQRGGRRLAQPSGSVFLLNLRVRKGRFAWKRTIRYPQTGGWVSTRVRGRFVDGGTRFVATVRERMANPQTRVRCDSRKVRFGGSVPERVLVNGSWTGTTAQGRPLTLAITPEGIVGVTVEVALTCRNGEQIVRSMPVPSEPGRVSDHDLGFRAWSNAGSTEFELAGTARRDLVSGTVSATDSISVPDGEGDERTYSCASGEIAFESRRT